MHPPTPCSHHGSLLAGLVILSGSNGFGAPPPITLDGRFDDWSERAVAASDPRGDGGLDLVELRLADEPGWFQMLLTAAGDFDLSDDNDLVLLLDTDDDPGTGLQTEGLGAELRFVFGARTGRYFPEATTDPSDGIELLHGPLSLQGAPTVTSPRFEIALARGATVQGNPLFLEDRGAIVLISGTGDRLPDTGTIAYQLDLAAAPPARDEPLERERAEDLRLVSWNVRFDSPWEDSLADSFRRLVRALDPDILNFQEIYNHSPAETRQRFIDWLGENPDDWYAVGNADCITVSRHPIRYSEELDTNLAVLIETDDLLDRSLLIVNAHPPCCTNDEGRQEEIDQMLALLRRVRAGEHPQIPANVAVQLTGDMNLVGLAQQLESLVTGDIVDEATWGPDVAPDVDGSALFDTTPLLTEQRLSYTYRNDSPFASYWPGRLDVSIVSDSVLELGRQLILETRFMSGQRLDEYQLLAEDSASSDHLPLVTDVRRPTVLVGDFDGDGCVGGTDLAVILAYWGLPDPPIGDLDGDGEVRGPDLATVLANWAPCD
ncbi:MAG: endonuclease/exonuclease/phosphatase family protein [Planctomycetota bacterium]|nr:endonuclease/exonuclease/phosphatase family protein [Planctomycetota bacterium]